METDPAAESSASPLSLRARLKARFPALEYRDFRLLWFGQMISIAGSQMQNVAIGWHIYHQTDSAVMLGLVGLFRVVPIVVFSLVGGVVADAYNRRRIMFITQSVMLLAAAGLGLVTLLKVDSSWAILSLTALGAAGGAFDNPARQSLIPNLVPPDRLANAVSLNTLMFQIGTIVGPAVGGIVIAQLGVAAVYWINALTFGAVITALALMRYSESPDRLRSKIDLASFFEGLKFVRSNRIILSTMLLDFFATFFASATALLPIFARDILHVGPQGLGMLYAAESVGAVITGFAMSLLGDPKRKGRVLLVSVALYGVATAIYGFSTNYALSLLLLGLVGAGDTVSTVLRSTIRQMATPDHIRGRMTSVNMIFFMGGPQLGNLEAGLLAAWIGAGPSVVIGGFATMVVVGLMSWRFPRLREYEG
jgi:MFS family permease